MTYTYDNGYSPCYDHDGHAEPVLDQTLPGITGTDPTNEAIRHGHAVIGWKAACACGWESSHTYLRADHPITDKHAHLAPEALADVPGPIEREWRTHVQRVLPETCLRDLLNQGSPADVLAAEVQMLRVRRVPWEQIAEATSLSAQEARIRWGHLDLSAREASGKDTRPRTKSFIKPLSELETLTMPNSVHDTPDPTVEAIACAVEGLGQLLTETDPDSVDQAVFRMERALAYAYAARAARLGFNEVTKRAWGDHVSGHGNMDTSVLAIKMTTDNDYVRGPEASQIDWGGDSDDEMAYQIESDRVGAKPLKITDPVLHQRLDYAHRTLAEVAELVTEGDDGDWENEE